MEVRREGLFTLKAKGDAKMQTVRDSFELESKYQITQIETEQNKFYEYTIKELSTELLKYQDPLTLQMMEYANKVGKIYDRLHVRINSSGHLTEILNVEEIRGKWKEVKDELMRFSPLSSYDVIIAKEKELSDIAIIKENVKYIHFMYIWRTMFGKKNSGIIARRERDRLGIGYMTPIEIKYQQEGRNMVYNGQFNDKERRRLNIADIKRTSQQTLLDFKYDVKGKLEREEDFWIKDAEINIFEQLSEQYKVFLNLQLKEETVE